jgi:hypothetical protein
MIQGEYGAVAKSFLICSLNKKHVALMHLYFFQRLGQQMSNGIILEAHCP